MLHRQSARDALFHPVIRALTQTRVAVVRPLAGWSSRADLLATALVRDNQTGLEIADAKCAARRARCLFLLHRDPQRSCDSIHVADAQVMQARLGERER